MFPHGFELDSILLDSTFDAGEHVIALDRNKLDSARIVINYETDADVQAIQATATGIADLLGGDSVKFAFVRNVVDRLIVSETLSLQERVDANRLDSLLHLRLGEADIDLDFAFGVTTADGDSLWLAQPESRRSELAASQLRTRLFSHDIGHGRAELVVQFPDETLYLWRQAGLMLPATALFVGILVVCFVYTIRALGAQRREASLMVDFVNNMTHEFKTPISTVALACEAIQRPDIISDRAKVTEFSNMIQSENSRMRRQTEKILQMAALEDKDLELDLVSLDVHELIETAVRNFSVQVEHRGGQLQASLKAVPSIIVADPVHIAAIIHNLLDNALKYSPEQPHISIATGNDVGGIRIAVEDQGMGIAIDDQKRVFDKYYRVSSGDKHDVKGFGLGLSYVALMVRLHGGRVGLSSQPGQGTRIELVFPREVITGGGGA
jgi:two-component system phosphate regulon sensor histidine kinase PhoR